MSQEDQKVRREFEDGSEEVIGALMRVHRALGPGLLESAYEACVCRELRIDCAYQLDVVVDERIVVELKSVESLQPIHAAQVITYMKLARLPIGLLVNFNVASLRNGLRRFDLKTLF